MPLFAALSYIVWISTSNENYSLVMLEFNDDVNMEKDIRMDTNSEPKWIQKPDTEMLGPVYQTQASYMGRKVDVLLTPFANIGQWFRPGGEKTYRNADAFTYAIWLYK